MKHAPVTRAHRKLAYEIIGWSTALDDLEPWLESGEERRIPQQGIDAAQLIADFEARTGHRAFDEGYVLALWDEAGIEMETEHVLADNNPYPEIDQ